MTSSRFLRTTVAALTLAGAACSSSTPENTKSTGGSGSGGKSGEGGKAGSGGALSSGGVIGTGGATSSGGHPGTGGTSGTGGSSADAGVTKTGGRSGLGGAGDASSSGGQLGTGGASGGRSGSGGASGTGTGGATGAGGEGTDGGVINPTACSTGTAQSSDVTVNLSSLQQKITGFGVSSAWAGSYRNASDADYLWSTTKGAGLTLLRIRYGDGLAIAKSAAQNGATVWMTPWGTGTNGATGGSFTTTQTNPNGCTGSMPVLSDPQGLSSALVTWVQNAKTQGVPIYAVSAENEPDSCGINSTTSYSAAQLAAWIDVFGPALAAINVKLMAPETMNVCGFTGYFNAIKADTAAWNAVDIFASHEYEAPSGAKLLRQLYGFRLARVELSAQFGVGNGLDRANLQPDWWLCHPALHGRRSMRIKNFPFDGLRDQDRAEKLCEQIGLTGGDKITQRRGVGDNRHG